MHPGANRVHGRCTRVQRQKCTRVQGVQTHPGANPGKAHISTALEPDWKFIFFSREATWSGEHIVHIDGGKPPRTASGGNLVGGFLMRNKRSPRCGVAPIEHAGVGSSPTVTTTAQPLKIKGCDFLPFPGVVYPGVHFYLVASVLTHKSTILYSSFCGGFGMAFLPAIGLPLAPAYV